MSHYIHNNITQYRVCSKNKKTSDTPVRETGGGSRITGINNGIQNGTNSVCFEQSKCMDGLMDTHISWPRYGGTMERTAQRR